MQAGARNRSSQQNSVCLDKNRLQLFDLYHKIEMCCRPEYQMAFRDVLKALALNLLVENKPSLYRIVFFKVLLDGL
jgi:hypothetical protein